MKRRLSDPMLVSLWAAAALIAGAFVAFFFAWRGTAATLAIQLQLPYLVSGGIGGACLLISGVAILLVQARRRQGAREYQKLGEALAEAEAILNTLEATGRPRE